MTTSPTLKEVVAGFGSGYDAASELVGTYPWWTNAFMEDEANAAEINETLRIFRGNVSTYDEQTLRDRGENWLSVFTTIANCNDKTLKVRFFEDDEKVLILSPGMP